MEVGLCDHSLVRKVWAGGFWGAQVFGPFKTRLVQKRSTADLLTLFYSSLQGTETLFYSKQSQNKPLHDQSK